MNNDLAQLPSERAQEILRALVEQYIREGHPVGSRTLSRRTALKLSPATIRNVMSDLEELGFVASPHTSAGRVPTSKGYRFFVDTLVRLRPPAAQDLDRIQSRLTDDLSTDSKALASSASTALAALTSMAGVVTIPKPSHHTLRHVEFLPLSDRRILAILVENDASVQNRILTMDRDYSEDELRRAANYLNENFVGQEMDVVRRGIVEELAATRESMNRLMIDVVQLAEQAFRQDQDPDGYVISGQTSLMDFEELSDLDKLRQLFEVFSQKRQLLMLLDRSIAAEGVQIYIGEESGYEILDECSIVTAPYRMDGDVVGVLGVIGPTRMAYERVIPIVDVTAKLVSAALKSQ